jgi:TrmH family RNA methyltransferase
MANMGLSELVLVNPVYKSQDEARALARTAGGILDEARICTSLEDAVQDVHLLVGTTRRFGRGRLEIDRVDEFMPGLRDVAEDRVVAFMFGSEAEGLLMEEIRKCDRLVTIPADPGYESLNLAQAVLLVIWEFRRAVMLDDWDDSRQRRGVRMDVPLDQAVSAGHMDRLMAKWEPILWEVRFLLPHRKRHSLAQVRRAFRLVATDESGWQVLMALGDKIRYRVGIPPDAGPEKREAPDAKAMARARQRVRRRERLHALKSRLNAAKKEREGKQGLPSQENAGEEPLESD